MTKCKKDGGICGVGGYCDNCYFPAKMTDKRKPTLEEQVQSARLSRAKLADVAPYMFPEWCRLKKAEADLEAAQAELNEARIVWRRITGAEVKND